MKRTVYQTKVSADGGRNGKVKSDNGLIDLEVRMPNSMGGTGGDYTNPEQLFGAAYSACFDGALNLAARQAKHNIKSITHATIGFQLSETEGANIIASIDVEIEGVERAIAEELVKTAHETCPYSKAIRNNVEVKVTLL